MTHLTHISCILLSLHAGVAQNTGAQPRFEAVSVRPVEGGAGSLRGGPGTNSPGRLTGVTTLKWLIMQAYDLKEWQIIGPDRLDSARYDIQATLPSGADKAQLGMMLQSLLTERFGLEAHRDTRRFKNYELIMAKGGPRLTPSTKGDGRVDDAATTVTPKFVKGANGMPELAAGAD